MPESDYSGGNNTKHGYASSTLTTDGERLYAFFGISGIYCLDLEGNTVWHKEVGTGTHGWGSATSPLLCQGLVIVNASIECSAMVAFNKMTGQEVWRAAATALGGETELATADGVLALATRAAERGGSG